MDEFNLVTFENFGLQLFELFVSFFRTLWDLVRRPGKVFDSITDREGSLPPETEVYGDGRIGYTSPVLFALTAIALSFFVVWSTSFYQSTAGASQEQISVGSLHGVVMFLLFAVVVSVVANNSLARRDHSSGKLRQAFFVACYATGFGLFREFFFTMAQWFSFAGSTARGRDPGFLLYIGLLCMVAGVGLFFWQLAIFVFGFRSVLGLRWRSAVWAVTRAFLYWIPLGTVISLLFMAPAVVTMGRALSLEMAVAEGRPDIALHHLDYLSRADGFGGSKHSLALRRTQLEALCYRRWLPAFRTLRPRLVELLREVERLHASKSLDRAALVPMRKLLHEWKDELGPGQLASHPMMPTSSFSELDGLVALQRDRFREHMMATPAHSRWPTPYPANLAVAISGAHLDAALNRGEKLRQGLRATLVSLDGAILSMAESLRKLPEEACDTMIAVRPAMGFQDHVVQMLSGLDVFWGGRR